MATRRRFDDTGGSMEDDDFSALFDQIGQPGETASPLVKMPPGDPDTPERSEFTGPGPDESGKLGNKETPREWQPSDTRPTPFAPSNLPSGVTVEEQMPEPMNLGDVFGGPEADQNFSAPLPPKTPTPTASRPPQPFVTPPETGAMPQGGATRRAVSPGAQSALFGDEASSPMFGRAGGLMGGGKGVIGAGEGGPEATDMMLNLMRMLKRGQMV